MTQKQHDIKRLETAIVDAKLTGVDPYDILDAIMVDLGKIKQEKQPEHVAELRYYYEKLVVKKKLI